MSSLLLLFCEVGTCTYIQPKPRDDVPFVLIAVTPYAEMLVHFYTKEREATDAV